MQISYLTDHPEYIAPLASHLLEQWRSVTPEQTLHDRRTKLEAHRNREILPIGLVAHVDGRAIGTAALREQDLEGRRDLGPWLGGVYVVPEFRGTGVGSALCSAVERLARDLDHERLYLFTLDKAEWYRRLGWDELETSVWRGYPGVIMQKRLIPG